MKHNRILACGALALALLASCKDSPDVPETVENKYRIFCLGNFCYRIVSINNR